MCCMSSTADCLRTLVTVGHADPDAEAAESSVLFAHDTPLLVAAKFCNADCIEFLIPRVNIFRKSRSNPMFIEDAIQIARTMNATSCEYILAFHMLFTETPLPRNLCSAVAEYSLRA